MPLIATTKPDQVLKTKILPMLIYLKYTIYLLTLTTHPWFPLLYQPLLWRYPSTASFPFAFQHSLTITKRPPFTFLITGKQSKPLQTTYLL